MRAVSEASAGLQRRTNLLWWKEALFSQSAGVGYREMATSDAAVLMAFDMYRHIPTFSPASVAAFLRETVIALPKMDQEKEIPIRELVEMTRDAGALDELRTEASRLVAAPEGRGSVLGLIGHRDAVPQIDHGRFRDLVGVQPDTMLTLPDWSVWMPSRTAGCPGYCRILRPKTPDSSGPDIERVDVIARVPEGDMLLARCGM